MSGKRHIQAGEREEMMLKRELSAQDYEAIKIKFGNHLPGKLKELMTEDFYRAADYLGLKPSEYAYSLLMHFGPIVEQMRSQTPVLSAEERSKRMEATRELLEDFSNEDFYSHRHGLAANSKEKNDEG